LTLKPEDNQIPGYSQPESDPIAHQTNPELSTNQSAAMDDEQGDIFVPVDSLSPVSQSETELSYGATASLLTDQPASDEVSTEEEAAVDQAGPTAWEITKAVVREIVETVVLTLVIFFLIQSVIRNFRVDGHSMDPNLHHGQYLVVDKISYRLPFAWRTPQRGDVIVFEPPTRPEDDFVKRIVALPGETVEIRQGQIYINGDLMDEPYLPRTDRFSVNPRLIPEGYYFVMGDNRGNSNDSRHWGALDETKIVGRAWISYWPPATWGSIPNDQPSETATLSYLLSNWTGSVEAAP